MERVAIFIDGSNFYKYLRDQQNNCPKGSVLNYNLFVDFLAKKRNCVSKRYYVGIARNTDNTEQSKSIVSGQQKFLARLENDGFVIKRGKVMYDKGRIREKGTDVKIAVDIVVGAVDDLFDTIIIISSDTDLIPALQYARFRGKRIEYVGFSHAPSFGMEKQADISILLTAEQIDKFKK
jgi:uncharacterized LabA/DUF88 family protein